MPNFVVLELGGESGGGYRAEAFGGLQIVKPWLRGENLEDFVVVYVVDLGEPVPPDLLREVDDGFAVEGEVGAMTGSSKHERAEVSGDLAGNDAAEFFEREGRIVW